MPEGGLGAFMWAAASVAPNGTTEMQRGCVIAREAVGTYTITLDRSLMEDNGVFLFSIGDVGAVPVAPRSIEHNHVSETVIRVWTVNNGGIPTDYDWHFACWRVSP